MAKIVEEKSNLESLKAKQVRDLNGIDGWLILLACGLILNTTDLAITLLNLVVNHISIFSHMSTLDLLMMAFNFVSMLFYIFFFIAMFKKLHFFPKLFFIIMIVFSSINLLFLIFTASIDLLILAKIPIIIVWLIYIKKSRRVHNTFIYDWKGEVITKARRNEQTG